MARSSQDSSSTRASHNYRFIRRVHVSENRRTPYGTEHLHSHVRRRNHRRGYPSQISFQFTGTTHIHTAITMMDAESFSLLPRDWHYPQPSGGFTGGAQMSAVRPGSVTVGYNLRGPGANLTPGVQTTAAGLGPAGSSGVGYNQLTPNATLGVAGQTSQAPFLPDYDTQAAAPPAVGLGLNNGGFTSGAQMNAVRPASVKGVYNPRGPGASLTPGPAVGLGPAGSSGVGYSQLSPIATLGFEGQTSQAPFLPEYDTQAAAPPRTLDQQLFPPSLVTAANNEFAEDFLPPAVSDNFMHMLDC